MLIEIRREVLTKKAIIVIKLVEESKSKSNRELEREIYSELSKLPRKIPWMESIEKVIVVEKN